MIDNRYLQDLVAILKTHGVKHIKMQGLELSFHENEKTPSISTSGLKPESAHGVSAVDEIAATLKKQEESLPPDLRIENINNQEAILNWSSPDQDLNEPEMPLTGEVAL